MNLLIKKYTLVGLAAVLTLAACGSDKNVGETTPPNLQTDVQELSFSEVAIGDSETLSVLVSNIGEGPLRISSVALVEETKDDAPDNEFKQDPNFWVNSVELATNESVELAVEYRPVNTTLDSGYIEIKSNNPADSGITRIPLTTPTLAPRVFSNPSVKFPRVPPVTEDTRDKFWKITNVQNVGQAPLEVRDITVSPNESDFHISFPESDDPDPALAANDSDSHPSSLAPGESFPVRVYFNPLTPDPSTAEMFIFSNDPAQPEYKVDLVGNSDDPCIEVVTGEDQIDFGEGAIGFANNQTITVKNCSLANDLDVSEISVCTDENGSCTAMSAIYAIKDGTLPADLPGGPAVIGPEDTESFVLTYTPIDTSVSTGFLTILSNDPSKSTLEIPITGKGTNNRCPEAIAEAKLSDSNRYQTEINTIPLKTVEFRGSNSVDPDGTIDRYEWTIVSAPINSTARLVPGGDVEDPSLFLDLAGEYVIELRVYDDAGTASCGEQAIVTINATPDEDIHIQLVWFTPADPDQTDVTGSDVDLHFLHPNGTWNRSPYCVFWNNKTNEWGALGAGDDPSLDIDDTNGAGPENINLTDPEAGLTYAIGVHYFTDRGFGPSYATVRVFIQGSPRFERKDQYLANGGTFWYVATISWPSAQIFEVGQLFDDFPNQ